MIFFALIWNITKSSYKFLLWQNSQWNVFIGSFVLVIKITLRTAWQQLDDNLKIHVFWTSFFLFLKPSKRRSYRFHYLEMLLSNSLIFFHVPAKRVLYVTEWGQYKFPENKHDIGTSPLYHPPPPSLKKKKKRCGIRKYHGILMILSPECTLRWKNNQ